MRGRVFIAAAAIIGGLMHGAQAAPLAFVAGGILMPPGGFSEEGMHPVFTECSLASFETLTSKTIASFVVRPNTNEAHFQVTNSCGTYEATFPLGQCQKTPEGWSCDRRSRGYRMIAQYFVHQGRPAIDATVYNESGPEFWSVAGFLLTPGVTSP